MSPVTMSFTGTPIEELEGGPKDVLHPAPVIYRLLGPSHFSGEFRLNILYLNEFFLGEKILFLDLILCFECKPKVTS